MTATENEPEKPVANIAQASDTPKPSSAKQLAIILVSAVILSVSSCFGMVATYSRYEFLFAIASVAFIIGVLAIPVALVWQAAVLISSSRKRGAGR